MSEINDNIHYEIIISEYKPLELNLKEVWKYGDLIVLFTKRNFSDWTDFYGIKRYWSYSMQRRGTWNNRY